MMKSLTLFRLNATVVRSKTFAYVAVLAIAAISLVLITTRAAQTVAKASWGAALTSQKSKTEATSITGTLDTPRYAHTATLLNDGNVLVAGGMGGFGGSNNPLNGAELYNPTTGIWTNTGNLGTARSHHTATLLSNGKVLVVGGEGNSGPLDSAELYDPSTKTWSSAGSLTAARSQHTATLLANGIVLVVGGVDDSAPVGSAELYDPATNTWSFTGSVPSARYSHTATLLGNGNVLIAGGYDNSPLSSAELYDPVNDTWNSTDSLAVARRYHTATLLNDGTVLVVGGQGFSTTLNSVELYDPGTDTWFNTASLSTARRYHTATLLSNGKVLILGGHNSSGALNSAELYDPANYAWESTDSLAKARSQHTATTLSNGSTVIAGGQGSSGTLADAELYELCISPDITAQPTNQTGCEGTPVTFSVTAVGSGLTYQWRRDGADISGATERTYTIDSLTGEDEDRYDVVVTGSCGSVTSRTVTLSVTVPTITAQPVSTTANIGASANFSVTAVGTNLTYQWRKNGIALSGATARTYTINSVSESDFGSYSVVVNDTCGAVYSQGALLFINGGPGSATSIWSTKGNLTAARHQHTATLLGNGKVLVAGGYNGNNNLSSAEVYDPATGTWSSAGNLTTARRYHTATLLNDGKVLVVGGRGTTSALNSAELYDPATNSWSSTGSLATARRFHTATLLNNGKVLVTGGYSGILYLNSAELYDPTTGAWSSAGTFANARQYHTATLLNNDKVLIAGGASSIQLSSAELYDPSTNTWSNAGTLATARQDHTATLLGNGKVLVAAGTNANALSSAELYDPNTNTWSNASALATARQDHTATLLGNGRVLVAGGLGNNALNSAELYDPGTNIWSNTENLATARDQHTATLLGNGKVLVVGGIDTNVLSSTELYELKPCTASSITTQPTDQTVAVGNSANFTVAVTGSPTPTIQWQISSDGGTAFTDIAGATNFTLNLTTTITHNGNKVRAVASNSCGSPATSNVATLTVNKLGTTTTLASSANPSVFGQPVTFTATVSSNNGTPTGTVIFKDGTTTLGTATLNNGQATFSAATLSADSHSITVSYDGDINFTGSISSVLSQVVNKATPGIAVTSSLNPSTFGQNVTFTATVSSSAGTPTGTIEFFNGASSLGTGMLNSSGVATLTLASLGVNTHSITASYSGDGSFASGTASAFTQTVNKANATVTVVSSATPAIFGQNVTFTATVVAVAPGVGTPNGTITFKDGATTLGTATLNSGTATFTTSALSASSHSITVIYDGDNNFTGGTSSALTQVIDKASSTTTLTSSANSAIFGQSVTFTATVASSGGTPSGIVEFFAGATSFGTSTLNNGVATLTSASLSVGSHALTVVYSGSGSFTSSTSSALIQTVNKVNTTPTLTSSANPASFGQSVSFTATFSAVAPGAGVPTGIVVFKDGETTLGTGNLSNGSTTFSIPSLSVGVHSITAVYAGDNNFNGSASTATAQTVNKATTTIAIATSATTTYGQSVTFTATLSTNTGTGTITFKDGAATLGSASLSGGQAKLTLATLSAGSHSITAEYGGDSNYNASISSAVVQTVNKASLTVTAENKTRTYGAANPTFTATYTGFVNNEGVSVLSGAPGLTTDALTSSQVGNYTITAAAGSLNSANYSFTFVNGTLTINKATLAVTAENKARTYGAANPSFTVNYAGFVNNENASVLTGAPNLTTTATATSSVGGYAITAAQGTLGSANYEFSFVNGTLTINKATLTVTAENKARGYGAANPDFTVSYSGYVNNEKSDALSGTPSLHTTATANSPVGVYPITVTANTLAATNYTFTFANGALQVNKAALTIKTQDTAKAYGAVLPNFTATYTGFVNSETASVLGGTLKFTTTATQNSPVGEYPVTPSGLTSDNYEITFQAGTLNVTTLVLMITAADKSRIYGTANPIFTVSYSGFVNGEDASSLGGALSLTTSATPSSGVGTYKITPSGLTSTNYALQFVDGTLTVTKAALTVTADSKARLYGTANPAFTGSLSGAVNDDPITAVYNTAATANSPVGTYAITPALNDPQNRLGNYDVTSSNGALLIGKASLTVKAENKSRAYGVANPDLTGHLSGVQNNDRITATYVTTAQPGSPVGTYPITPTFKDPDGKLDNYEVQTTNGTLTISKAMLTVTATDQSKTYGAANPSLTYQITGFGNGESASVLSGTPQLATTAVTESHVGNYPITITAGTLSATNYELSFVNGTLTIKPSTLTVTAENKTKVYGTANPPLTVSFAGLVNGDTLSLVGGSAELTTSALPNSPAGAYAITVSGVANSDYNINFVPGTLTITPSKPLLTLAANRTPSAAGQSVTFTAYAEATTPFGGKPGGTITFSVDGNSIGSAIVNAAGQATFSSSTLAIGSHAITATYSGDNNYQAEAKEISQTVSKSLSFTTLASSASPASTGQNVTLTAKVRGNNGTPSGQVEFFDGSQSLGVATISDGVASLTVNTLTEGAHTLTATYKGSETFAGSVSDAFTQTVAAGCTFTLSQKEVIAAATGGSYTITLDTRNGCTGQIENANAWIEASQAIVNGQTVITLNVAAQAEAKVRVGKLKIAGQDVTVTQSRPMAMVGAASYDGLALASDALASVFGTNLASDAQNASSLPLPVKLLDVRLKLRDAKGTEHWASLLYVSPKQVNFLIPADLPEGEVIVTVLREEEETSAVKFRLEGVAPGLFSADQSGTGAAAAVIQRVGADGTQSFASTVSYNAVTKSFDYQPISLNTGTSLVSDDVYLLLFGTGIRHRTSLGNVTAQIGGLDAEILYAGDQMQYVGLDQINIRLPQGLAGRGLVDVVLFVDGKATNTVKIFIQ